MDVKRPMDCLYSTIRDARTGPTPGSSSNSLSSALLMSIVVFSDADADAVDVDAAGVLDSVAVPDDCGMESSAAPPLDIPVASVPATVLDTVAEAAAE